MVVALRQVEIMFRDSEWMKVERQRRNQNADIINIKDQTKNGRV